MPFEPPSGSMATPATTVKVEPWPTEAMLKALVIVFSVMIWLALAFTIFGLFYVAMFGIIFFIGHVVFISHVRGNGVRLGPDQMPDLYHSVDRLAKQIGFEQVPEAYILQAGGILNALATKFFKSQMIILYSDLIAACGDNTAARDMIVAHELGHLKEGHLKGHWFLLPGLMMPFLGSALSRAREYTSDRYGMAYCGSREGGMRGLAILAAGAERGPKVNLQSLARQVEDLNTGWMTLGSWLSSHPSLANRVIAIEASLKPVGYTGQRGMMRALGIIGAVYVLPMVFTIIAIAIAGTVGGLAKAKQQTFEAPVLDDIERYPDE